MHAIAACSRSQSNPHFFTHTLSLLQAYVLRKLIEHRLRMRGIHDDDAYICSLSSRTLVYKGQLTPEQASLGGCVYRGRELI